MARPSCRYESIRGQPRCIESVLPHSFLPRLYAAILLVITNIALSLLAASFGSCTCTTTTGCTRCTCLGQQHPCRFLFSQQLNLLCYIRTYLLGLIHRALRCRTHHACAFGRMPYQIDQYNQTNITKYNYRRYMPMSREVQITVRQSSYELFKSLGCCTSSTFFRSNSEP
jgi:hypothetical protein